MQFYKQPVREGRLRLTDLLLLELKQNKSVLWLVTGGSSIKTAVAIMNDLSGHESNLTISLTDERYGPVGHPDSNWQQLLDAGFNSGSAKTHPVLENGLSLEVTAQLFSEWLDDTLQMVDIAIGQFGIGSDGHISGILPHSVATEPTEALAICYKTDQYARVTTSFAAIKRLNMTYCFVYGEDKQLALQKLLHKQVPLAEQPAQILKQLSQAYVYNDQVGE